MRCRNCKGPQEAHLEGACLFDSTRYDPMNNDEEAWFNAQQVIERIRREDGFKEFVAAWQLPVEEHKQCVAETAEKMPICT